MVGHLHTVGNEENDVADETEEKVHAARVVVQVDEVEKERQENRAEIWKLYTKSHVN